MSPIKQVFFVSLGAVLTVAMLVFINLAFASIDTTEEIRTNVNGYKCVTFVYHDNRMFGEDDQTFETFCKD